MITNGDKTAQVCSNLMPNGSEKVCRTQGLLLGVMAEINLMIKLTTRWYSETGRDK